MRASIAICTHNRAADLREALLSVARQNFQEPFEVIVVDNRSTDRTKQVALEAQALLRAPVRYVYEERLGLSVARNRAIREAEGEYILFLDDDAAASADWLREIVRLFDRDARVGCVGGRIEPVWEGGAPDWLPQENRTLYSILDYADEVKEMPAPDIPFGANMALRSSLFEGMAAFREDLGRVGGNLLSNEESELIGRVRANGWKVIYTPNADVLHKIPRSRINRKWLLRRIYWQGVSKAIASNGKTADMVKSLLKMLAFLLLAIVFLYDKRRIFRQISRMTYHHGLLRGMLRAVP